MDRIGRYSRADLEAMHGKRGRKPPEYFQLFPERIRAPAPVTQRRATRASSALAAELSDHDPLIAKLRAASPAVRQIVADLLALTLPGAATVMCAPAEHAAAAEPQVAYTAEVTVTEPLARAEPVYADPELEG